MTETSHSHSGLLTNKIYFIVVTINQNKFYVTTQGHYSLYPNSQMKAPGLTTMIDGKNKTLYIQVICFYRLTPNVQMYDSSH